MPKTAVVETGTEPIETIPGIPEEDDLPDTVQAPPEALAPLPDLTLQQVRDDLGCLARVVDAGLNRLPTVFAAHQDALVARLTAGQGSLAPVEAGALQSLIDTLETLGARGFMMTKPYTATIQTRTPGGFTMQLSIERVDGKDFFAALTGMEAWLRQAGYVPLP